VDTLRERCRLLSAACPTGMTTAPVAPNTNESSPHSFHVGERARLHLFPEQCAPSGRPDARRACAIGARCPYSMRRRLVPLHRRALARCRRHLLPRVGPARGSCHLLSKSNTYNITYKIQPSQDNDFPARNYIYLPAQNLF